MRAPAALLLAAIGPATAACLDTESLSRCAADPSACDADLTGDPCVDPVPSGNLTGNPSFETDLHGWGGDVDLGRVQVGSCWAARLEIAAAIEEDYLSITDDPDSVSACAAGTYRARAYVKADAPSSVGKSFHIAVRERLDDQGPNYDTWYSDPKALLDEYQIIEVAGPCQVAGHWMDVYVYQLDAAVGDAFVVDLITLVGP